MQTKNQIVNSFETLIYLVLIAAIAAAFVYFIAFYQPATAYGESYKHIAIEFSETCKSLQALNDHDTCSSPEFVKSLFPPTKLKLSYQLMFDNAKQGEAERYQQNNAILNHKFSCVKSDYCNVFDIKPSQKIVYWYEPDSKTSEYYDAKIIINANIKHKNLNTNTDAIDDNGTARKIDLDTNQINIKYCKQVTFDPNYIEFELGRLIWFISGNCTDDKRLGYLTNPFVIDLEKTDLGNLSDSYKWYWLYNQTEIKEKYKEYRIGKD